MRAHVRRARRAAIRGEGERGVGVREVHRHVTVRRLEELHVAARLGLRGGSSRAHRAAGELHRAQREDGRAGGQPHHGLRADVGVEVRDGHLAGGVEEDLEAVGRGGHQRLDVVVRDGHHVVALCHDYFAGLGVQVRKHGRDARPAEVVWQGGVVVDVGLAEGEVSIAADVHRGPGPTEEGELEARRELDQQAAVVAHIDGDAVGRVQRELVGGLAAARGDAVGVEGKRGEGEAEGGGREELRLSVLGVVVQAGVGAGAGGGGREIDNLAGRRAAAGRHPHQHVLHGLHVQEGERDLAAGLKHDLERVFRVAVAERLHVVVRHRQPVVVLAPRDGAVRAGVQVREEPRHARRLEVRLQRGAVL
mmetsp:Transcript_25682/g.66106  ORF Transcript_25682/g.66106 Transcript_25682/m.66106 type:complete len:363 (-) Transcript_25682:840-1928(-)